jgi:hypothetical protein
MVIEIQGIVRSARQTMGLQTDVLGNVIEGVRRVLDFVPLFERRGPRHVPPKPIVIWSFLLEPTGESSFSTSLVSAEIAGPRIKGIVRDGDEVVVTGTIHKSRQVLIATAIRSLRTGERISRSRF